MHHRSMVNIPAIPRFAMLFSGHMIDTPGRKTLHFPPSTKGKVRKAFALLIEAIGVACGNFADGRRVTR
jgi:hypothetical protein